MLEYSGRHLALIEAAQHAEAGALLSLLICLFAAWGMAPAGAGVGRLADRPAAYRAQAAGRRRAAGGVRDRIAKMRVFRYRTSSASPAAEPARPSCSIRLDGSLAQVMPSIALRHLPSAGRRMVLLLSFALLYQRRLLRADQDVRDPVGRAGAGGRRGRRWSRTRRTSTSPPLLALAHEGASSFRWRCTGSCVRLTSTRTVETALGVGPTMIAGVGLVTLSILVVLPVTADVTRWRARIWRWRSRSCCWAC